MTIIQQAEQGLDLNVGYWGLGWSIQGINVHLMQKQWVVNHFAENALHSNTLMTC